MRSPDQTQSRYRQRNIQLASIHRAYSEHPNPDDKHKKITKLLGEVMKLIYADDSKKVA